MFTKQKNLFLLFTFYFLLFTFYFLLFTFFVSCRPGRDARSGKDHTRSGAVPIKLGVTIDDKVSADSGDHTDWKRFLLEDNAEITINIYWDNPAISSTVTLRDQFAGMLKIVKHQDKAEKETIEAKLTEGQYFIQIEAVKGESVYTLEVITPDLAGASGIPRPE